MQSLRNAEKSISFLVQQGFTEDDKKQLVKAQVKCIKSQVKAHQEEWDKKQVSRSFLTLLCEKILNTQIQGTPPDFDPRRVMWTDVTRIKPEEKELDSVVYKNRVVHSSGSLYCDVVVWRQKKRRSLIHSIAETKEKERIQREKRGTRRFSVKIIDFTENDFKKDEGDVMGAATMDPRRLGRNVTDQYNAFMITFHRKAPSKPSLRKVVVSLTPVDERETYTKRLNLAQWEADPSKHVHNHGATPLNSYGFVQYSDRTGTQKRALMEVNLETISLRNALPMILQLPRAQAVLPVMKDILQAFKAPPGEKKCVWRRLSMSFIKIHEELSDLGQRVYRAGLPKNDYKCDEGTALAKALWVKFVDRLALIEYIPPEILQKMNLTGHVQDEVANGSEDIWAAGIIFFQLVWKGIEPEFLQDLRQLRTLAEDQTATDTQFEEVKQGIKECYKKFHQNHYEEAQEDALKYIVLQMLEPDPQKRITAENLLKKLESLSSIYSYTSL